jgi:hypothetical protein
MPTGLAKSTGGAHAWRATHKTFRMRKRVFCECTAWQGVRQSAFERPRPSSAKNRATTCGHYESEGDTPYRRKRTPCPRSGRTENTRRLKHGKAAPPMTFVSPNKTTWGKRTAWPRMDSGFPLRHGTSYHGRPGRRTENRTGWPGIGRIWSDSDEAAGRSNLFYYGTGATVRPRFRGLRIERGTGRFVSCVSLSDSDLPTRVRRVPKLERESASSACPVLARGVAPPGRVRSTIHARSTSASTPTSAYIARPNR